MKKYDVITESVVKIPHKNLLLSEFGLSRKIKKFGN